MRRTSHSGAPRDGALCDVVALCGTEPLSLFISRRRARHIIEVVYVREVPYSQAVVLAQYFDQDRIVRPARDLIVLGAHRTSFRLPATLIQPNKGFAASECRRPTQELQTFGLEEVTLARKPGGAGFLAEDFSDTTGAGQKSLFFFLLCAGLSLI